MLASILLILIFALLAALHFSWAFGSKFGFAEALPTKENGERILNPKKIDCVIVGLGLTAFALFYVLKSGFLNWSLPEWVMLSLGWGIPSVFILRAIGEFNYVGFFKKIRNTTFGKLDSKFFSPLCLLIGILGIVVQWMA